jgi:hypothetical protein
VVLDPGYAPPQMRAMIAARSGRMEKETMTRSPWIPCPRTSGAQLAEAQLLHAAAGAVKAVADVDAVVR